MTSNWDKYLSEKRKEHPVKKTDNSGDVRTEFEKDQDRIAFSTPLRRLADKTQVFPLEKNDSVRTRLTHSLEVANIAWNFGVKIATNQEIVEKLQKKDLIRILPPILRTAALMHDFGNPPFGHQGEGSIRDWFEINKEVVLKNVANNHWQDFLNFEGNAQGFRLITKLQLMNNKAGLDLTYATLASFLKYPYSSSAGEKKYGYFFSEEDAAEEVLKETGLQVGKKHPLNYLMEASDDIAYSIMDVEDAVKKEIVSFFDLVAHLKKTKTDPKTQKKSTDDPHIKEMIQFAERKINDYSALELHSNELSTLLMERMRAELISYMATQISNQFIIEFDQLTEMKKVDLFEKSGLNVLKEDLISFAKEHAYRSQIVLTMELKGKRTIQSLMDIIWIGISAIDKDWKKRTPEENYIISKISKNYLRIYESELKKHPEMEAYFKLRLLTDMISGMTDGFAVALNDELTTYFPKR